MSTADLTYCKQRLLFGAGRQSARTSMHEGFEEEKKRRQEDRKRVAKGFNLSKLASMDDF